MMALGSLIYAVSFPIFGLAKTMTMFIVATLLIALGEMIVMPVSSALAAKFAPEDMRGRYMAVFGVSWSIPSMIGPWSAGMILDNYDPNLVWYLCGIISALAITGFIGLYFKTRKERAFALNKEAAHPR